MSHSCPECGMYCTCDMEDLEQEAPDNCKHACDTELEDAYDDWEPGMPDVRSQSVDGSAKAPAP